jgi:hypothetical protein
MKEVPNLTAQCLDQVPGTGGSKADHVYDHLGMEVPDAPAERACCLFRLAVKRDLPHCLPGAMGTVGLALPPADLSHLVSCFYQPRHEVGTNVPTATNDDDPHDISFAA